MRKPGLDARLGDALQRARDRPGAGVVVDQGRRAVADGGQHHDQGAVVGVLERQLAVEPPPEVAQHFVEVVGRLGLAQAAHQRAVEVHVGVDEAGHDQLAAGVDRARFLGAQLAGWGDPGDPAVLDEQAVPVEQREVRDLAVIETIDGPSRRIEQTCRSVRISRVKRGHSILFQQRPLGARPLAHRERAGEAALDAERAADAARRVGLGISAAVELDRQIGAAGAVAAVDAQAAVHRRDALLGR